MKHFPGASAFVLKNVCIMVIQSQKSNQILNTNRLMKTSCINKVIVSNGKSG